jgi:hypothetical protein
MTTEEARNTEVDITKNSRAKYGNAHIVYDMNDGLIDIILEKWYQQPTAEQRAERVKTMEGSQSRRTMTKEKNTKTKKKYRSRFPEGA